MVPFLTCARVSYAMARDESLAEVGQTHAKTHVPIWSIIIQAVIACASALVGNLRPADGLCGGGPLGFYILVTGSIF